MQNRDILQEPTFDEMPDEEPDDEEVEDDETERPKNKWELYKSAKAHLDSESDDYDPQKALQLLALSAEEREGFIAQKYRPTHNQKTQKQGRL